MAEEFNSKSDKAIKMEHSLEKCREWIETNDFHNKLSYSNISPSSGSISSDMSFTDEFKDFDFGDQNDSNIFKNVVVKNCKRIHLGNVTNINGAVFFGYPLEGSKESFLIIPINKKVRILDKNCLSSISNENDKHICESSLKWSKICNDCFSKLSSNPLF